jgi:hypothetical protein
MTARASRIEDQQLAKIDKAKSRGVTAERERARREHFAAKAKSTADGVLNGYAVHLQPDAAKSVIREFASRLKALEDGPGVASFLGELSNTLNADIKGGRTSARKAAEALFSEEGA